MSKKRVLFVCVHNSARSVMAEAFVNKYFGDKLEAESAGLEPGKLNPYVVKVMSKLGIDVSGKIPQSVFELFKSGKKYHCIITVCDGVNAERCPIFPGVTQRLHWSFDDPSNYLHEDYDESDALKRISGIRDEIKYQIEEWASSLEH